MILKKWCKYFCLTALVISFSSLAQFKKLNEFGDNPGEITASYFQPEAQSSALVVLLHGCLQNAENLAVQSGFVALAKQHNFTLLLPQQSASNNVTSCFNWFSDLDSAKDKGEVLSIKNMTLHLKRLVKVADVYIVGLSAGGALSSSLLVHYPQMFVGGAVIAGLPYPCANNLAKAISCMRNAPSQSPDELARLARSLSPNVTRWPKLIVITGNDDKVVNPKNANSLAKQWAKLTVTEGNKEQKSLSLYQMSQWLNDQNIPQVRLIKIANIGHGISVNPALGNRDVNVDFLLKSLVDSGEIIVDFWGF